MRKTVLVLSYLRGKIDEALRKADMQDDVRTIPAYYLESFLEVAQTGEDGMTTPELCDSMKLLQTTTARMMMRFDAMGLMKSTPYHGMKRVTLTAKGKRMAATVKAILEEEE